MYHTIPRDSEIEDLISRFHLRLKLHVQGVSNVVQSMCLSNLINLQKLVNHFRISTMLSLSKKRLPLFI